MGNSSVLLVLGFISLFAIIGSNLNRRNLEAVDNVSGYACHTLARNIANSAINIALRTVDTTSVLPSSFTLTGTLHGGSYSISATTSGDTLTVISTGEVMDSAHTIRATMVRYPKPFPTSAFESALGILPRPVGFLMQGNSARIDGRDHDSTGALLPEPREDKPAVNVMHPDDSLTVLANTQNPDSMLQGSQKIAVDPDMSIPPDFITEVKENADYTYQTPLDGDLTIGASGWGSATNPAIVYVEARDTNKVKFAGNSNGWGILVVHGSIEITGNLQWHGLVVAYSNTVIDFKTSGGNSTILGSFVFEGEAGSTFTMKGTGQILRSKSTLEKAKNVNKLLAYTISEWYE